MNVRVELLERWDRLPFSVSDDTPVATLKRDALSAFGVNTSLAADYVVKLRGFEVLNENESVAESGARDGSTYLVMYRRRRAVR
jgi:hypothetical protein